MKYANQVVKCGCCGKTVEVSAVVSRYRKDSGLDQKPGNKMMLPSIQECPECHYCSNSLKAEVSENIKERVHSEDYQQNMAGNDSIDRGFLRLQAALVCTEDEEKKAFFNLWSAWYCEWEEKSALAENFRAKAVGFMEKMLEHTINISLMLIYIDSLRQLKEFEKAEEVIKDIEEDVKKNLSEDRMEYKVFMLEKRLVEAEDANAHWVSEAM